MPGEVPTPAVGELLAVLPQLGRAVVGQATAVAAVDARLRVVEARNGADWSWLVVALFAFAAGLVARRVADVWGRRRVAVHSGGARGDVRVGDLASGHSGSAG